MSNADTYKMSHQPNDEGALGHDLAQIMTDDAIYKHPEWFMSMKAPYAQETVKAIRAMKGNPLATVTVYRSMPRQLVDAGITIEPGNWVSVSREYVAGHQPSNEEYVIVEKEVAAYSLRWPGDYPPEFGYFPPHYYHERALPVSLVHLAHDPDTPPHVLRELAEDTNNGSAVDRTVAENRSAPPEALAILATRRDTTTRYRVAQNPNTSPEILTRLTRDSNWEVIHAASHHPATPTLDRRYAQLAWLVGWPEDSAEEIWTSDPAGGLSAEEWTLARTLALTHQADLERPEDIRAKVDALEEELELILGANRLTTERVRGPQVANRHSSTSPRQNREVA